jgi:ribosomal protein S12 methylthiotransferase accessory factor
VACFGCHLDPLIAIRHAVTELGMMMAGWKPFLTCRDHEVDAGPSSTAWPDHIRRWLREVSVDDQPQMRPAADKAPHALLSSLPAQALASLPAQALGFDGLSVCLERLAAAAMDVVVVDATRPDIGMPVVRVLAPGLRHFRPRFAPGRLFDIPVIRGLRDRPLLEEELNPIPLVF